MLKTIQIKLIHILGGYTKEEYKISSIAVHNKAYDNGCRYGFESGVRYLAKKLHDIAINIYPCSQQEWIDKIWNEINKVYQNNVK